MRIIKVLEDFIYKRVIRNILLTSKLGRQSVLGEAATGYNFDHMYAKISAGYYGIGKIIDFILLRLPAVKATRARKDKIIEILSNEILALKKKDDVARIMDVACGAGRYLTDIESKFDQSDVEIIGVDFDRKSLNLGKELAAANNISERQLRYFKGNVFCLGHLKNFGKSINWKPNIIIASGLVEYLDEESTKRVFGQVYEGLTDSGLFIFFSQQANPSQKLMEKVCTTKEGPWVLYYRKSEILHGWLWQTGFRSISIMTDKWGMYNLFKIRKKTEQGETDGAR